MLVVYWPYAPPCPLLLFSSAASLLAPVKASSSFSGLRAFPPQLVNNGNVRLTKLGGGGGSSGEGFTLTLLDQVLPHNKVTDYRALGKAQQQVGSLPICWYGGSELLPQGRCGRHLPPVFVRSAAGCWEWHWQLPCLLLIPFVLAAPWGLLRVTSPGEFSARAMERNRRAGLHSWASGASTKPRPLLCC